AGPIARHPDDLRKLPVIPAEFYAIAPEFEWRKKVILLCDWRWHRGQMMTIVSRRLARAGATVLRFAWLP
ncbi:MAG TPA: hypothetical protein VLB27_00075, partial [candidate division Zixibacteria bacterium]|nr:hypothetical protein [candidate division Zixibacteria bacterium]